MHKNNLYYFLLILLKKILNRTEEYLADVILHRFVQTLHSITLQFTRRRHQVNKAGNCIIAYKTSCLKYNNTTYNNHHKLSHWCQNQYNKILHSFALILQNVYKSFFSQNKKSSVLKDKSLGGMRKKINYLEKNKLHHHQVLFHGLYSYRQ